MGADPAHVPGRLDPEAAGARVGKLFERHGRLVLGVCRLLLRDPDEAEDATQQTFLSAYRSLLTGHEPREPAAWLGTIARNECRMRIRARMSVPLYAVPDAPAEAGPEPEAVRHEEIAALTEALAGLPQRQREAIVLREFYGLSHDDVAHALGVSASAVDALLVRARKRLQKELRPARVSAAALVLPLALRDALGQAIPGFLAGGGSSGIASKLASLPLVAKLAGATATVAVVGVGGGGAVHDRAPLLPAPRAAEARVDPSHGGVAASPLGVLARKGAAETNAAGEHEGTSEDERESQDAQEDESEGPDQDDGDRAEGEAGAQESHDEGQSSVEKEDEEGRENQSGETPASDSDDSGSGEGSDDD